MRILRIGAGGEGSGARLSELHIMISTQGSDKPNGPVCTTPDLTLNFLRLLLVAGGVGLQRVAAAVERIVAVLVVKDTCKADLPLVALASEVRVQTQAAAVQILQPTREQILSFCSKNGMFLLHFTVFTSLVFHNDNKTEDTHWMHIFIIPPEVQCVGVVSRERSPAGRW